MKYWSNRKIYFLIFFLIVLCSVILISYKNSDNQTILEDKEEIKVNRKHFGMYVENEGEFVEYTDSELFPNSSMYTFNEEKSYCVDNKDNVLETIISYSNGKVTVTSNKTIYCTLYFNRVEFDYLSEYLLENPTTGLNTTLDGGLYRYQGTSVDNYVCFGTSNKEDCLENTDEHIYRIIGITEDGRIKLIKNEALNSGNVWYSSTTDDIFWSKSTIYTNINNDFFDNDVYIPDGWDSEIETTTWKYGNVTNVSQTALALFNIENGWTQSVNAKIGIIHLSDYYYAYQSGGLNCKSSYATCVKSWLHLNNCDTSAPSTTEWTMSRYGFDSSLNRYYVWSISSDGSVNRSGQNGTASVRPVFYLRHDAQYVSGTGVQNDPFILYVNNTIPSVSVKAVSNNTPSPKISIISSKTGTYCVNTISTTTNFNECILSGSITANTETITSVLSSNGTYYVHVKDSAGIIGGSSAVSITIGEANYVCTTNTALGTCLKNAKTTGYNSNLEGGLYRYQGTKDNVDNYICFGTSDKGECLENTDAYMYRVIGVDSSGKTKVLKNEALESTIGWYSNYTTNITWPDSTIYLNINSSSFLTNEVYMLDGWEDKIETIAWKYGDNTNVNVTASSLYNTENGWTNKINAKIGLLYAHDYAYAYQSGGLNCSSSGAVSTCIKSWMFMNNCDSGSISANEQTMSRYGLLGERYSAWYVYNTGYVGVNHLSYPNSIRPVFFLTSSVNYVSGSGKSDDPFIIS